MFLLMNRVPVSSVWASKGPVGPQTILSVATMPIHSAHTNEGVGSVRSDAALWPYSRFKQTDPHQQAYARRGMRRTI